MLSWQRDRLIKLRLQRGVQVSVKGDTEGHSSSLWHALAQDDGQHSHRRGGTEGRYPKNADQNLESAFPPGSLRHTND